MAKQKENGSGHDKFVRLANKRVANAIKAVQLVGNLSNRNTYQYEPNEVTKIFSALQNEVDAAKEKFGTKARAHSVFSL